MQEQCQRIGEVAGKIYKALETSGGRAVDALPKEIGVSDTALFNQAIGWLCREDKLHLEKKGSVTNLSLATAATHGCCQ